MVRVSNVIKRFGNRTAVAGVSFTAEKGGITALLGPNGAGKTTTMRVMTGYYVPDSGDVLIEGISVLEQPIEARRAVGYLPESNPLYRDFTTAEHLVLAARLRGIGRAHVVRAVDRVVRQTQLESVYYRPVRELSKGFRQRLGLACALVGEPAVLILDEPTEGLDPNQRTDVRKLLKTLAAEHTLILSTHVLSEAQELASHVVLLNSGTVAASGTQSELLNQGARTRMHVVLSKNAHGVLAHLPSVVELEERTSDTDRLDAVVRVTDADAFAAELSEKLGRNTVLYALHPEVSGLEELFSSLTTRGDSPSA